MTIAAATSAVMCAASAPANMLATMRAAVTAGMNGLRSTPLGIVADTVPAIAPTGVVLKCGTTGRAARIPVVTPGIVTKASAMARIALRKRAVRNRKSNDLRKLAGAARTGRSVKITNADTNVITTSAVTSAIASIIGPKPDRAAPLAIERAALGVVEMRGT